MSEQLIAEHTPFTAEQWAERWRLEADARNQLFQENRAMREAIRDAYDAIDEARECVFGEVGSYRAVDVNLPKCKAALLKLQSILS